MRVFPKWLRHPAVVAAFVTGLLAIVVAFGPVAVRWISGPDVVVVVQTGGLYRDLYHQDKSWLAYDPQKHGRERFWVALNVVPKKDVAVNNFIVGGVQFKGIFLGYDNHAYFETVRLTRDNGAWLSVPIELERWDDVIAALSKNNVCLLLDPHGKAVAEYELPAIALPKK